MKTPELIAVEGRIAGPPGAEGINKEGVLNLTLCSRSSGETCFAIL